jgi:hypothetical protein
MTVFFITAQLVCFYSTKPIIGTIHYSRKNAEQELAKYIGTIADVDHYDRFKRCHYDDVKIVESKLIR